MLDLDISLNCGPQLKGVTMCHDLDQSTVHIPKVKVTMHIAKMVVCALTSYCHVGFG